MNELCIVVALVPLGFLGLAKNKKIIRAGLWLSMSLALICLGYFLFLHFEAPLVWGPVLSFLIMLVTDAISRKTFPLFSALGATFVAQALLAQDASVILVLIVLADMFLVVEYFISGDIEEKNRAIGNIYRSLVSLCPAAIAVLLGLPEDLFPIMICLSIVLRLFSWPLRHWTSGKTARIHQLIISGGSTFALWHILSLSNHPEWAVIWLLLATILSVGAGYFEVYLALNLGLFSISPALGVLGTALWPLLVHQSRTVYFVGAGVCIVGALIADFSPHVFLENIDYGLSGVCAIALARVFVAPQEQKRLWYFEGIDVVLSLGLLALFVYTLSLNPPILGPLAVTFAGLFVVTFVVGRLLVSRKPKWFGAALPLKIKPEGFKGLSSLDERAGRPIHIADITKRVGLFEMIQSESHLIWLLGILGALIIWGRR